MSGSSISSMRSRTSSLPRLRWRATYFAPPPPLTSASCSTMVWSCALSPSRFLRYPGAVSSTRSGKTCTKIFPPGEHRRHLLGADVSRN
ncbi:Uncharacterised protein [Mycobacteroides abscessus subsp. abscessus]|nr:Uncharacterised protein [Mycobacteroides abscessus subsp. abscessus]